MERNPSERTVSFQTTSSSPPPINTELPFSSSSNNNNNSSRIASTVAPGYAQLSPSTGSLRMRRVASHRRVQGGSPAGSPIGGSRSDGSGEGAIGTSPQLASLFHGRHGEDPLMALLHRPHSVDSMADIASTASPVQQSPVTAFPGGNINTTFPTGASRDSITMQELIALQHQQMQQKGVTVIYPQGASPTDPNMMRMADYASMQDAQSVAEDSANEDRVQVRVEGYFEGTDVNVLIPNDLPPSTLLYVLTASDGRDLMFKLTQYSLQLIICFLKMPSLFSPEVQVFTGPWAERLYRNYNTIRHGRSLFKIGRGLLNLFTLQTVCERMWMRYESAVSRQTCNVLLPVVTRVEKLMLLLGASPSWGRAMSRQLLHWSQAAELTPGQRRAEESPDATSLDWRIQERMKQRTDTAVSPGALLADDTFTHISEVERSGHGGSGGGAHNALTGAWNKMINSSFADLAIHNTLAAMGFSTGRFGAGSRDDGLGGLPSQPVIRPGVGDDDSTSLELSARLSPQSARNSFAFEASRSDALRGSTRPSASISDQRVSYNTSAVDAPTTAAADALAAASSTTSAAETLTAAFGGDEAAPSGRSASRDTAAPSPSTQPSADSSTMKVVVPAVTSAATADRHTSSSSSRGGNGKSKPYGKFAQYSGKHTTNTSGTTNTTTTGPQADTSTSSSADDGPMPLKSAATPPFVHGTLPQLMEHDHLPGMTPSKNTTNTQPTADSYLTDVHSGNGGGRVTLLRPLPRNAQHSSATDPEGSMTGDEGFITGRADSTLHEDGSSMLTVAAQTSSRDPLSMPDNWRPAMAPTVPPSQSDEFGYGATLCFADHGLRTPPASLASPPPPPIAADDAEGRNGNAMMVSSLAGSAAPTALDGAVIQVPEGRTNTKNSSSNSNNNSNNKTGNNSSDASLRRSKMGCPPFEVVPAVPTEVVPVSLPASASSSLSAMQQQQQQKPVDAALDESEMSILTSEANSSFHVRPSGASGAMTTWLNELQPASAALPARARKGILQFNPVLMTLLGIRNLAAAFRRFLRDAMLISTERFMTFTFVEVHRRSLTRFINRCWLIISIIDLLLNTVRLLQPGWGKYATARQNIRCRCGCQGDDDPADTVWRTHGFIARRKTDLFFPPLNLDYGAPMVSTVAYMEAADPARLMPACSRCGCLYKELPSESAEFEAVEGTSTLSAVGGTALNRSAAPHTSIPSETPFVMPLARQSQTISDEGDRSASVGAQEREKPRWVQMYEAELHEAEEKRRRVAAATSSAMMTAGEGMDAGNHVPATTTTAVGLGARRETHKPSSATIGSADADGSGRVFHSELVDLAAPPAMNTSSSENYNINTTTNSGNRQLKTLRSRDTDNNFLSAAAAASSLDGLPRHQPPQRRESAEEQAGESSTGILFVPWMMRKFFDYVWLLRVHPNLSATLLLEARYLAEFYLSYKYCFGNYETYSGDAPLSNILHPYGAIAGIVSAAVGLLRVVESAPTS